MSDTNHHAEKYLVESKERVYIATLDSRELISGQRERTLKDISALLDATTITEVAHVENTNLLLRGTRAGRTSVESSQLVAALDTMSASGKAGVISIEGFDKVENSSEKFDRMQESIATVSEIIAREIALSPNLDPEYLENILIEKVGDGKVHEARYKTFDHTMVRALNTEYGLALNEFRINYFVDLFQNKYKRVPTLSELHLFSQLNSEHCQHNIFKGVHIIDGKKIEQSFFKFIQDTYSAHPGDVVVAYSDNGAILKGSDSTYTVIKVETHNHPSMISPFPGGATGSGGDYRDIMATGRGSIVETSTSAYAVGDVTRNKPYRKGHETPLNILTEASKGVNDYGNKFAAPMINGSTLAILEDVIVDDHVFSHAKPIVMAGAAGRTPVGRVEKDKSPGLLHIKLGGPDYSIGIGGAAASSLNAGENTSDLDFASVQRANAQMQIKVKAVLTTLIHEYPDAIKNIHDYGAGGHGTNIFELYEGDEHLAGGGEVDIAKITVADKTMKYSQIMINESQERMGLLIDPAYKEIVGEICKREKCPVDFLGTSTTTGKVHIYDSRTGKDIINVEIKDFILGDKETFEDTTRHLNLRPLDLDKIEEVDYLDILRHPTVGSKGYIVNHVDRSVRGNIVQQQTVGRRQLPINDYAIYKTDPLNSRGTVLSQGMRPFHAIISPEKMARFSLVESLLNIAGVKIKEGSLSASGNRMVSAKAPGGKADLYKAVKAFSEDCIELGINVPVGKDSLSMQVTTDDGTKVNAPATLITSLFAHVENLESRVTPELKNEESILVYIAATECGSGGDRLSDQLYAGLSGSIAALQSSQLGDKLPAVSLKTVKLILDYTHSLIENGELLACHDISEGGLRAAMVEMYIAGEVDELDIQGDGFDYLSRTDNRFDKCPKQNLLSELPGVLLQIKTGDDYNYRKQTVEIYEEFGLTCAILAEIEKSNCNNDVSKEERLNIFYNTDLHEYPAIQTSYTKQTLLDAWNMFNHTIEGTNADAEFKLPAFVPPVVNIQTPAKHIDKTKPQVMVLRDEGTNGEYDMMNVFKLAGFDPREVTITDLQHERYSVDDCNAIVLPGGFSYGDRPRAGKAMATVIKNNPKIREQFSHAMSKNMPLLAVCNGNQVIAELGLVTDSYGISDIFPMQHNESGKFESRFLGQKIIDDDNIRLQNMGGSILPIRVAHGEGKYPDELFDAIPDLRIPTVYMDKHGKPTEQYPYNPNGSKNGAAGLLSKGGNILSVMPHPERTSLPHQLAYAPKELQKEALVWLQLFKNLKNNI